MQISWTHNTIYNDIFWSYCDVNFKRKRIFLNKFNYNILKNKIQTPLIIMIKIVPYLFLLGALLAAIACLGRADYNLPVFLFAYIAWMYMNVF